MYGILFSNNIVQTEVFLSFGDGEAGAKPIVLQHHEQLRRLRIRTYLLSTTPCVLRLELIYAKYATQGVGWACWGLLDLLGWACWGFVWSDTAFIEGSPDWRPNILFSLFTVNCKITPRQSLPPQCLASELEMAQCCDVFVISKFDFVLSPGNVLARL